MPPPQWNSQHGIPLHFSAVNPRTIRGDRIAGAVVSELQTADASITLHEWERGLYQLGYRLFRFLKKFSIFCIEKQTGLRMQAVLTGELHIETDKRHLTIPAGHYHFTPTARYRLHFKKKLACHFFVGYYPDALLEEFHIPKEMIDTSPRPIPNAMLDLLHELFHHPYHVRLQPIYYQNMLRDLFFLHLRSAKNDLPSTLRAADIAAVYRADALLSADIAEHYSIAELSRMAGTNAFKLKKGFREIFKMGLFGRLIFQRMKRAQLLLETTDKTIKEIAFETGYNSTSGFIHAFRKHFNNLTPQRWREVNGKNKDANQANEAED